MGADALLSYLPCYDPGEVLPLVLPFVGALVCEFLYILEEEKVLDDLGHLLPLLLGLPTRLYSVSEAPSIQPGR